MCKQTKSKSYDEFVDKFKPRHTTDDCFTPANVYAVVLDWAAKKYGFDPSCAVRPFCPGGDYQAFEYAPDAVVVDNPPFSIVTKIVKWYNDHGIRFFLFCPGLTAFGIIRENTATFVSCGNNITFDNGAQVIVGFVTNMGGDILFESAPDLHDALEAVNASNVAKTKKHVAKYRHPTETITSAGLQYLAVHHTPLKVRKDDAKFIRKLDSGESFFGGAFLLSERAAAERDAAHVLSLSPREKELQRSIGK